MKNKVVYYNDEENDDFAGTNINTSVVDESYKYVSKSHIWNTVANALYYFVAAPISWVYTKVKFGTKIKNKRVIRKNKGGYFLYSNHTLMAGDAFHPNIIGLNKKTYIVVGPDTVSIKGLQNVVKMLGAVPLPSTYGAAKNYLEAIKILYEKGGAIAIYPEAHIWPYCSFIRPFKKGSCRYPVELNAPSYIAVTTYQKRRFSSRPKVTIYIDGPYYIDTTLPKVEAEEKLRLVLQEEMKKIMKKYNTYEYVKYIKVDK